MCLPHRSAVGRSDQPGIFTAPIIRTMAAATAWPVILPLSNPTSKCEAQPADLMAWTKGLALVATGSPFEPVVWEGREMGGKILWRIMFLTLSEARANFREIEKSPGNDPVSPQLSPTRTIRI
jgi:malic enzyme